MINFQNKQEAWTHIQQEVEMNIPYEHIAVKMRKEGISIEGKETTPQLLSMIARANNHRRKAKRTRTPKSDLVRDVMTDDDMNALVCCGLKWEVKNKLIRILADYARNA